MSFSRAVTRFCLLVSILAGLLVSNAAPVAAAESISIENTSTQFAAVLATAKAQLGDRWSHFAKGPNKFDCVGFVWYSFNQNGLKDLIGGYNGVKGYFKWFKERGLTSSSLSSARPGDLLIWGKFKHVGMYLGPDLAISALVNPWGVSIHRISKDWIGMPVKAVLHVQWGS